MALTKHWNHSYCSSHKQQKLVFEKLTKNLFLHSHSSIFLNSIFITLLTWSVVNIITLVTQTRIICKQSQFYVCSWKYFVYVHKKQQWTKTRTLRYSNIKNFMLRNDIIYNHRRTSIFSIPFVKNKHWELIL